MNQPNHTHFVRSLPTLVFLYLAFAAWAGPDFGTTMMAVFLSAISLGALIAVALGQYAEPAAHPSPYWLKAWNRANTLAASALLMHMGYITAAALLATAMLTIVFVKPVRRR